MTRNIFHVDFNNAGKKEMLILSTEFAKKLKIAKCIGITCYTWK